MTWPTVSADFWYGRPARPPSSSIAWMMRRCTGLRPSRTSGRARPRFTYMPYDSARSSSASEASIESPSQSRRAMPLPSSSPPSPLPASASPSSSSSSGSVSATSTSTSVAAASITGASSSASCSAVGSSVSSTERSSCASSGLAFLRLTPAPQNRRPTPRATRAAAPDSNPSRGRRSWPPPPRLRSRSAAGDAWRGRTRSRATGRDSSHRGP